MHLSYREGINKHKTHTESSRDKELTQIKTKGVFHPIHRTQLNKDQTKNIIRSKIFFKEKYRPDGTFEKLKARLVAGGHLQDRTLYEDLSSPTVCTQSVFMIATIAANEHRHVCTIDIGGAYLNAKMTSDVYMYLDVELSRCMCNLFH